MQSGRFLSIVLACALSFAFLANAPSEAGSPVDERNARTEDSRRAIVVLSQQLALHPKDTGLLIQRAVAFGQVGRLREAICDCDTVIKLEPQNAHAYLYRGRAYLRGEHAQEALVDLNRAVQLAPNDADMLHSRGMIYEVLSQYDNAAKDFAATVKKDPKRAEAYVELAHMDSCLNRTRQVVDDYTHIIALRGKFPEYTKFIDLRAQAYTKLKEYEKAAQDYSQLIKLSPDDEDIYNARANVYLKANQNKMAADDFSKSIELCPTYAAAAYFGRSVALERLGDKSGANRDRAKAESLGYDKKQSGLGQ